MNKKRVFLVEDHPLVRYSIRTILELEADIEVVGEAADSERALHALENCDVDVVLMDIELPGINGIDATRLLKEKCPDVAVLILTSHSGEFVTQAREAGAIGYVLKLALGPDLIQAVRNACEIKDVPNRG